MTKSVKKNKLGAKGSSKKPEPVYKRVRDDHPKGKDWPNVPN